MESAAVSNKPTHKLVRRKACLQNFSILEGLENFKRLGALWWLLPHL